MILKIHLPASELTLLRGLKTLIVLKVRSYRELDPNDTSIIL